MNNFRKFMKDIFTGRDNRTYDLGRVLWFQSVQAFIAVTIYSLYKGGVFDPVTWGAGLSALVAGGGAAIGLKAGTEPTQPSGNYLETVTRVRREAESLKAPVEPCSDEGSTDEQYNGPSN